MPPLRDLPIKRKITAIFLGVCGAALACFAVILFAFQWSEIRSEVVGSVNVAAKLVADHAARSVSEGDLTEVNELLASLATAPEIKAAVVVDLEGRTLASFGKGAEMLQLTHLDGQIVSAGKLYLTEPIQSQGRRVATLHLKADYHDPAMVLLRSFCAALCAAFVFSAGFTLLMLRPSRRLLVEPIQQLAATAAKIGQSRDFRLRAPKHSNDELGLLADTFNQMLGQVEAREAALKEAEHRYRRLFHRSPVPMLVVGVADQRILAVNEAAEELYGYPEAEFLCLDTHQLRLAGCACELALAAAPAGSTEPVECQHLRKDGSVLFVELTTQAHVFAEEPAQLVQVIDMTERRRAATALLASEERFRAVVENLTEGLLLHDASGRILYANPSMAELVGCTSAELDAISAGQLLNPPQGAALAFERQQYETELKRRDGSAVSVAIKTSPLTKANGDTIATVAVVTDLSARKAAAAEIAQSQARLIEVSRLAGMAEVATGVLHNVGNVLNSVNVSATVVGDRLRQSRISGLQRAVRLLEQHAGNLGKFFTEDPKGKLLPDYLGKLYWQLDNERNELVGELAGLTKNLGHIKEIVAMQQTYAKVDGLTEAVSPAVLLEDALRLNEESLVRNSVTVDRDYDATAPTVTVDKHKVLEILVNLITNARHAVCDAARPDRKIRVRVAQTCNRRVSVEVQDNGVGIPQENLVRIFQHGFTTKKNGHGFGLHSGALAARQMGGSLTVNSEGPGQGATFKLELPIGETKPAPN
jgi:PAS domain S-box-containing protein